jgi:succinate--hydroxymethylglutarate CoA-transferase
MFLIILFFILTYEGKIKMMGLPVKYSLNKTEIKKPPPLLGEDTDNILKRILKMNDKEIQELRNNNTI